MRGIPTRRRYFVVSLVIATILCGVVPISSVAGSVTGSAPSPSVDWTASVPAPPSTRIDGMAAHDDGVVVAGFVDAALEGQQSAGGSDIYVVRFNGDGSIDWTLQFGTPAADQFDALAAKGDAIYVAGTTYGDFNTTEQRDYVQGFVAKIRPTGSVAWIREFEATGVLGVAAGFNGSATVVGRGRNAENETGALVRNYDSTGLPVWTDFLVGGLPRDVAADLNGLTVFGDGWIQPQFERNLDDVWLRRYDYRGRIAWTKQFDEDRPHPTTGLPQEVSTSGFALAASESSIYAMGTSTYPLEGTGEWSANNPHPFIRSFDFAGNVNWTRVVSGVNGVGDCDGMLNIGFWRSDGWGSGEASRITVGGDVIPIFSQAGSTGGGEWRYEHIARAGNHVFVSRRRTVFDPTTDTWDIVALTGAASPAAGCSPPLSVTPPRHELTTGGIGSKGLVRVVISWAGFGGTSRINRYQLRQSTDGGGWNSVANDLRGPSNVQSLKPKHTYRFAVRAVAKNGSTTGWVAGPTFTVGINQDSSTAATYEPAGSWQTTWSPLYLGGSTRWSTASGAAVTLQIEASSAAWLTSLGPGYGPVHIYVDGILVSIVDVNAASATSRRIPWAITWPDVRTRTVRLEVEGNTGRRIDFDALMFSN